MIKKFFKLIALIIIISCFAAGWYWNEYKVYLTQPIKLVDSDQSKNKTEYLFTIKKGELIRNIANNLHDQAIITHPGYFRLYARLSKKAVKIKAGEYSLKPGMTIVDVIDLFISGKVNQYALTIVDGWTVKEALNAITSESNLMRSSNIVDQNNKIDTDKLKKLLNLKEISLEGLLYPDTYHFPRGTSDFQFIKRAYDQMHKILAEEWDKRDKNTPLKSPYEALILASIVEKESGVSSERSKVAGVFIRRLLKKMRLQSDPTIIYGMGERYKGNIRRRDINEKTAYNTYQISGLPPTPIAIPGREAIHAVLHPDNGKSLYFVADGSGGHKFSNNLKDHNRAVRKYILKKK
ncbi:MAG: endolytic transglycosylase MltG [gamma proteobacterium symbiont of Bathyaustriella thionipta]|nr:endolytic transglycosylase MltG [gamma proteobacterium symbiont of Bathyaustriella thionipta]MCU7949119.1 endolytic transglycosylase MltG [gamma proteobacterium symbiont of Bathyaustriella thionipta]MCU7954430.1 endolytic transglycosylase MltG [gamma proteobacterium symbiont of Bathyaustriella thionipta]MCU7955708.1 endolytic transglycosylase MltG [gamma proteobacterium symbiont of Bathyaustriella thionipta]MCU7966198.1 endolytic transglycosylase MltG [gamma proteobacterium symbiont of Bathy